MNTIEREIVDKLHRLSDDKQQKVLEFIDSIEEKSPRTLSARELMKLPADERDRLVAQAFELAVNEDFETFSA